MLPWKPRSRTFQETQSGKNGQCFRIVSENNVTGAEIKMSLDISAREEQSGVVEARLK